MHKKYYFEVKNEFGRILQRSQEIYDSPEEARTAADLAVAELDAQAARDEEAYLHRPAGGVPAGKSQEITQ
jgi:hypothetical protein